MYATYNLLFYSNTYVKVTVKIFTYVIYFYIINILGDCVCTSFFLGKERYNCRDSRGK